MRGEIERRLPRLGAGGMKVGARERLEQVRREGDEDARLALQPRERLAYLQPEREVLGCVEVGGGAEGHLD